MQIIETLVVQTELVEDTLLLMASKQRAGQRVSVAKAVGDRMAVKGREITKPLLSQLNSSTIASDINEHLLRLSEGDKSKFVAAWGLIAAGVIAPAIVEAPFYGWSTPDILGDFSLRVSGLGIPNLTTDRIPPELDQSAGRKINEVLMREGSIGYFFRGWDKFSTIGPLADSLAKRYSPHFLDAIQESGLLFEKCLTETNTRRAHA